MNNPQRMRGDYRKDVSDHGSSSCDEEDKISAWMAGHIYTLQYVDGYHETEPAFLILMLTNVLFSSTGIQTPTIAVDRFSTQPPVSTDHYAHVPMSNEPPELNDAGWFRDV